MAPHQSGGLRLPRVRGPQDLRQFAPAVLALGFVVVAGGVMSQLLPPETSRWMRLGAWLTPASLAFLAWWWKIQRD